IPPTSVRVRQAENSSSDVRRLRPPGPRLRGVGDMAGDLEPRARCPGPSGDRWPRVRTVRRQALRWPHWIGGIRDLGADQTLNASARSRPDWLEVEREA